MNRDSSGFSVVDLFSGAGGMSFGFHRHPAFSVIAAADVEQGKPSSGGGALQCNATYARNMGIEPVAIDLSAIDPRALPEYLGLSAPVRVDVLSACPPCTGFSRTNPNNHLTDDRRNSLVRQVAQFGAVLNAEILVMENARELIRGNFSHHYHGLCRDLADYGYAVVGGTHVLSRFGLPQIRERAIVLAVRRPRLLRTLDELWQGWRVREEALTVRRAFAAIDPMASGVRTYPGFTSEDVVGRLKAIPRDGGSWVDLLSKPGTAHLLTPSMQRIVRERRFGSYPDVYGRMAWNKPAPTIKRECSHIGNGRYAHPEHDRLCSVREMAMLQGFPNDFVFSDAAVSNLYRHIGDAVPPLISFQIAHLCAWMLTDRRPAMSELLLPGTHLSDDDLIPDVQSSLFASAERVASASGF